jgi:hypothetical protein
VKIRALGLNEFDGCLSSHDDTAKTYFQHSTRIQAASVRCDTQKKATRRWRLISILAVFSG